MFLQAFNLSPSFIDDLRKILLVCPKIIHLKGVRQMKLAVIGTGYVGLVAGVCFADSGNHVIGVDIDESKIAKLKDGISPLYEPGLDDLLKATLKTKRIEFTTNLKDSVKVSDVIFIAVGTPEGEDGSADLTHVLKCAEQIAQAMESEKVIVLKSTVPVGTAEKVAAFMNDHTKYPFHLVSNPEFLKEGASIEDFLRPDRVVIGCNSDKAKSTMLELYAPFVKNGHPILFMKNKSAELCKYAANSFLATKISFINELALLSDAVGADIDDVKKGFTTDARINPAFFYPGVGYGGSCFPKDVKALIKTGQQHGVAMDVVAATDKVNEKQKSVVVDKMVMEYKNLSGLTLTLWGLAFKPRTDDVRDAPSFAIIDALLKAQVKVNAYDPVALENTKKYYGSRVNWFTDSYEAVKHSDGLVLVTEWNEFRSPDWQALSKLMNRKVIFDGRNIYDPKIVREHGFKYYCIGRERI
jgi:UDPglucose 6-dehydrogenase